MLVWWVARLVPLKLHCVFMLCVRVLHSAVVCMQRVAWVRVVAGMCGMQHPAALVAQKCTRDVRRRKAETHMTTGWVEVGACTECTVGWHKVGGEDWGPVCVCVCVCVCV